MTQKITKAVITAAGYGTRMLPVTKNIPKEMLPILNKPMIHYVVEQFLQADITDLIIVVDEGNTIIRDYFQPDPKLASYLASRNKLSYLSGIQEIIQRAKLTFINQDTSLPYGNARPLYSARHLIGDEPFIYMYGDGIMFGPGAGIQELVEHYYTHPSKVVLTGTRVTKAEMLSLGMIRLKPGSETIVAEVIEKPKLEQIDSDIATVCSYIFSSEIFRHMNPSQIQPPHEFQIQDAINKMIDNGSVTTVISKGKFLTNGDIASYLEMIVQEALARPDVREIFCNILSKHNDLLKCQKS